MKTERSSAFLCIVLLAGWGCTTPASPEVHPATNSLRPAQAPLAGPVVQRLVYVPVYSSIPLGPKQAIVELTAIISVRNTSPQQRILLNAVRYYDSAGREIRNYLSSPSELGPLASTEFSVPKRDTSGGPGANFLLQWSATAGVDEPLIESIMVGQFGTTGISFTSAGRVLANSSHLPGK